MTYTFKLARRLAVLRIAGATALLVLGLGCDATPVVAPDDASGLDPVTQADSVDILPDSLTVEINQPVIFAAHDRLTSGSGTPVAVDWKVSGGTITADGVFSSDTAGQFRVTARKRKNRGPVDTAIVVVVLPPPSTLVAVTLTPDTATVDPGSRRAFSAVGKLSDSSTTALGVNWTATGGTVDPSGVYSAGTTPGAYRVIATNTTGLFADTADVTISAPPPPPPPTLASVIVTPAAASLAAGATQRFASYGRNTDGDSVAVPVTYTATGGTITTAGLYTAGSTGGTFRIIAKESSAGLADTAVVTVAAPPTSGTPTTHAGWYAAPSGSAGAAGSASAPWSLTYALQGAGGRVQPGDTVWLRGGTYRGSFTSTLAGTSAAPIIVRQYPGERATVDGNLVVFGNDTWFWGFEVVNTNMASADLQAFNVKAPGAKLINLVIHDASGDGAGVWAEAPNAEMYGSLLYNNGRQGSSAGRVAHGIYSQNASGAKRFADNVVFQTFGYGFHFYTEGSYLRDFTIDGNVVFNNGMVTGSNVMVGGGTPVERLTFSRNMSFQSPGIGNGVVWLGRVGPANGSSVVRDNYLVSGDPVLRTFSWADLTVQNNTFVRGSNGNMVEEQGSWSGMTFSGNTWYGTPGAIEWLSGSTGWTYDQWRSATGKAATDTYRSGKPTGQVVFVRPNQYEPGRANVVVYNWNHAGSASVDLSNVLNPGDGYVIRNAQQFFGPAVATGTYGGGSVVLPLSSVQPTAPLAGWPAGAPSTGTDFQVFVVLPTAD